MFKLYYAPGTCALASHIALEEAGAGYEAIRTSNKQRTAPSTSPSIPRAGCRRWSPTTGC